MSSANPNAHVDDPKLPRPSAGPTNSEIGPVRYRVEHGPSGWDVLRKEPSGDWVSFTVLHPYTRKEDAEALADELNTSWQAAVRPSVGPAAAPQELSGDRGEEAVRMGELLADFVEFAEKSKVYRETVAWGLIRRGFSQRVGAVPR